MKALQKKLEQREKSELIAIIQQMLRQEPGLEWVLTTPLPASGLRQDAPDPEVYRKQVLAAMEAGGPPGRRKLKPVEQRLAAIKATADAFVEHQQYVAALTVYEVLVTEIIEHFNDYRDDYIAFCVTLQGSVDGLDSCFAGEEDDLQIRLRVLKTLFNIYRFYTDSYMDLDEDIPGLLVGNTTAEEREVISTWVRDAIAPLKEVKETGWGVGSNRLEYETLLAALAKGSQG
jgi:hypothetical protein